MLLKIRGSLSTHQFCGSKGAGESRQSSRNNAIGMVKFMINIVVVLLILLLNVNTKISFKGHGDRDNSDPSNSKPFFSN